MNKIKKRFSSWKWWASLSVILPLFAIFLLVGMPLFLIGILAIATVEGYVMLLFRVMHRLHVFAHGWANEVRYDGVLGKLTLKEKNND